MFESLGQIEAQFVVIIVSALLVLVILRFLVLKALELLSRNKRLTRVPYRVLRRHYFPSLYIFLGIFIYDIIAFAMELEVPEKLFNVAALLAFTWVVAKTVTLVYLMVSARYDFTHKDNIRERRIRTQAVFLEKIVVALVWIVGISVALTNVEEFKGVGNKLLASAGIASVVIGFAAQKGLGNLIAGFQIAFTQPIRLDDVVIVEGEWGRIEEITLTYVVVRIWDNRNMILPVTYFTQSPFQNWTRSSSDLLGQITFWADYNLDVERLRSEVAPIVEGSELYNGKHWDLQVVETSESGMQIRMLLSADDSSQAWHLRCEVREKVLAHLRDTQPQALPRVRIEREPT